MHRNSREETLSIAFLAQVRALGLQVLITELDVNDSQVGGDVPARDAARRKVLFGLSNRRRFSGKGSIA